MKSNKVIATMSLAKAIITSRGRESVFISRGYIFSADTPPWALLFSEVFFNTSGTVCPYKLSCSKMTLDMSF